MGLIGSDGLAGVYWTGQDGNVYTQNNLGQVTNAGAHAGAVGSALAPGSNATINNLAYRAIADPNAPATAGTPPPSNPNGITGGSSAPATVDRSNDIALQNAGLSSADTQNATGLATVDKALGDLTGKYNTEATNNEANYTNQTNTNIDNQQKGKESSLLNAAKGRQGLFGTLASLGALNGDGIKLANRAVQSGANDDLAGVANTYGTNKTALDTGIGTFRSEDAQRRIDAANEAEAAKTNVNNTTAQSKQTFYSKLADDYTQEGDKANAQKYTGMASNLYPSIAATSLPNANVAYQGSTYTPSTLGNYLSNGTTGTQVSTTARPDAFGIPGLVSSTGQKKALS
jgi:hypothetical protein